MKSKYDISKNNILEKVNPENISEGKYIISKNIISIGDEAFSGCSALSSIEIPNSVTSIGNSAFSGCDR